MWSWLYVNGHVILILILTDPLLSTKLLTELLQASCYCHPHLSYTDLGIISYTSTLALSKKKVLRVLQSQGQAACLIAGSREKNTYISAPF